MAIDTDKFAPLGRPRRIWAIGAVHGEVRRLAAVHDAIGPRFEVGERLVYLGNLIGRGGDLHRTVDELLGFRRDLIAMPGMLAADVVYLRGAQEEMWQKLLQLQFAPNPGEVLRWMLNEGVAATLEAYGGNALVGQQAARAGAVQLTRWTNGLRAALHAAPGHTTLFAALKRAAFALDPGLLLVSAGLDPTKPLAVQGDSFWWRAGEFAQITEPFERFGRIIRGFDPANGGIQIGRVTATLDAGCGRGGRLAAGLFDPDGTLLDLVEV